MGRASFAVPTPLLPTIHADDVWQVINNCPRIEGAVLLSVVAQQRLAQAAAQHFGLDVEVAFRNIWPHLTPLITGGSTLIFYDTKRDALAQALGSLAERA